MILPLLAAAAVTVAAQDTTWTVRQGMRLDLRNQAGQVRVSTWARNQVQVTARGSGVVFEATRSGSVLLVRRTMRTVRRDGDRIRVGRVDDWDDDLNIDVTVPAYLDVELTGVETNITVTGTTGDVVVETVEGFIDIRGGNGFISARSVEDQVRIQGARGRIEASSGDGDVWIADVIGQLVVESIDGDLQLDGIDSDNVSATTVDGDVTYQGTIRDQGQYRFSTHDGDVILEVPPGTNATVSVATFEGNFETSFPITLRESIRRRFQFTLGTGSARVGLESFDGDIVLRRAR